MRWVSICGPTGLFCLSYFTLLAVQVVFHQRTILHKLEQYKVAMQLEVRAAGYDLLLHYFVCIAS